VVEANGAQQTVDTGLAAGQSVALWFAGYQYGSPNTAIADATDLVDERDETNNQLSQMLPIPTPPLPCPTPSPQPPTIKTGPATRTPTPTTTPTSDSH
jgi:hypothetical protein